MSLDEPTEPMRTGAVGAIDGWEGLVVRDGAAPLRLRLEPLHPEAGRQAFDAKALGAALGLKDSSAGASADAGDELGEAQDPLAPEPWRLTLSVAARPGSASSYATVVPSLRDVRIAGLKPLVPSEALPAGASEGPVDPLIALFRFPNAPLLEGESCDLVFWGPSPEGPVRAILPEIGDVQLITKVRSANRSSVSIARLDARGGDSRGGDPIDSEGAGGAGDGR